MLRIGILSLFTLLIQGLIKEPARGDLSSSKQIILSKKTKPSKKKESPIRIPASLMEKIDSSDDAKSKIENTERDLSLFVGIYHDEKVLKVPLNHDLSGTYKRLVKVRYNRRKKILRFYPKRTGLGTLFIKNKKTGKLVYEFHINVLKTNLTKIAKEMKTLLRDIDGIEIKIINDKILIDGEIFLPRDMIRIHHVVIQYGDLAHSLVTLSSLAQVKIAQHIERAINNPEIQVKSINGKFVLEGFARSKSEKDRAEIIAKTYVPDVVVDDAIKQGKVLERKVAAVVNLIKIKEAPPKKPEPEKIIQLVVHFVELKKEYSKAFKFQWTPDIADDSSVGFTTGGRSSLGGALTTLTGTVRNLLPKLNWAKEHGHARVLKSTSLIVQDGHEGVLNSIEKIPYRALSSDGKIAGTSFVDTGLKTKITPKTIGERSNSIRLFMSFSITALLGETQTGPLVNSHEIQTTIIVRSRNSAAVGGLISNQTGTAYNKVPPSASNPIISLYNSKNFRRNRSQFIVFVTPRIQHSASDGADKIKRKFRLK